MQQHGVTDCTHWKRAEALCRALCIFVFALPLAASAQGSGPILLLCSYHQGDIWTDDIVRGVQSVLSESKEELRIEYLDSVRHDDADWFQIVRSGLEHRYRDSPPQLIICADDAALDFLLVHRDTLFPATPIVFCGINDFHPDRIAGHKNITGVNESLDIAETIEIALQMHPRAKHLVALTADHKSHWRANAVAFRELIPAFTGRIQIRELKNLKVEDAPQKLQAISPDSIVLVLCTETTDETNPLTREDHARFVSQHCVAPVYTLWYSGIGTGLLGGKLVSGFPQGEAAAGIALRVLDGESASDIPVVMEGANVIMFDSNAMKRFGLRENDLPAGSRILFKQFSLYEQYRIWFWIVPSLFVLQSLLVGCHADESI